MTAPSGSATSAPTTLSTSTPVPAGQSRAPPAADPQETAAALTAYARRHPRAWAALRPVFETTLGAQINSDGTTLPMIALDLAESHCGKTIIQNGFVLRIAGHPHLDSGVDLVKGKLRGHPDATTVRARSTKVRMAAL